MNEKKLKLVSYKAMRRERLAPFLEMSQEEAESQLTEMGYTSDTWDELLSSGDRKLGSHEVRLLIIVAKGEKFENLD